MNGLFDYESKLFRFLAGLLNLVLLNLLWLACCLPIITIGASTAALYSSTMKMVRGCDDDPFKMFFHAFRQNFKSSLPVTLILLFVAYMLYLDYAFLSPQFGTSGIFHGICILFAVGYAVEASFVFPVLARFECTTRQIFHNAFLIALSRPTTTVMVTALNLVPVWLLYAHIEWAQKSQLFWCVIGVALIAYVNSLVLVPLLQTYTDKVSGKQEDK